jgi:tRNA pseudouridine55 synthase
MAARAGEAHDAPTESVDHSGIIVLDKPGGPTSRELVNRVARLFPKAKVGHSGTLDPLAGGILIVCVGTATRLTELIQLLPKSYRTIVCLGARSDTDDAQGSIVAALNPSAPSLPAIQAALESLQGNVLQQPPEFSALKVKGQRAYDLARAGRSVPLAPRLVQIDRIELLGYEWPHLELEIDCSKGVYIRSIARDLGEALGCGGYVQELTRTRIGPFTLDHAVAYASLGADSIKGHLRPPLEAVSHLTRHVLDEAQIAAVVAGRAIALPEVMSHAQPHRLWALVDEHARLIALAEPLFESRLLQPRKVLVS